MTDRNGWEQRLIMRAHIRSHLSFVPAVASTVELNCMTCARTAMHVCMAVEHEDVALVHEKVLEH